ncbi:MAG: VanZ family protein [Cyanobacteria bacterium J06649_4]
MRHCTFNAGHGFTVGYFVIAIILFTLNPFQFQPYTATEFWVWRFSIEDFARNILLFLPFGLAMQQASRQPHIKVLVWGFLLSFLVEVLQLFIEIRSSNIVDLISNSSGALFGSFLYRWLVPQPLLQQLTEKSQTTLNVPLAFMYAPLCWVSVLMPRRSPAVLLVVLCSAIAAFALIQFTQLTQRRKNISIAVWGFMVLLPLFNQTTPSVCLLVMLSFCAIAWLLSKRSRKILGYGVVLASFIALYLVLFINGTWLLRANNLTWNVFSGLRLMEGILAVLTAGTSIAWLRKVT